MKSRLVIICLAATVALLAVPVMLLMRPGVARAYLYSFLRGEKTANIHLILLDQNSAPVPNAELLFVSEEEQVLLPIPWSSWPIVRKSITATTDHTGYCRIQFLAKTCTLEKITIAGATRKPRRQHDFGQPSPITEDRNRSNPSWFGGREQLDYVTEVWIE